MKGEAQKTENGILVFKARSSPYDELFKTDQNFRSFALVIFLSAAFYILSFIVRDSVNAGRFTWNIRPLIRGWGTLNDIKNGILIEAVILSAGLLVHPIFKFWISLHKTVGRLADIGFFIIYTVVVLASFLVLVFTKFYFNVPSYISVIITVEQLRFCMKSYSFIRENAYKVLYPWHKDDTSGPAVWYDGQMSPTVGSFSQYFYFFFCPSLLYRDHYPRNPGPINWSNVFIYFLCFLLPLLVVSPFYCVDFWPQSLKASYLLIAYFSGFPFGIFIGFLASICMMHGWMNMTAELLRFADRSFYSDWWNSTTYQGFYRKWNNIPHHFIHVYLYKDIKKITNFKPLVFFIILLTSSIIHEYIICMGTGHVIPILTLLFAGVGVLVVFIWPKNKTVQSMLLLIGLMVGIHSMIWFNIVELKARELCPREETVANLFIPRFIECYAIYNS